jgi:hypothetical protein
LFDSIVSRETNFGITLRDVCHSKIGWFDDKTLSEDSLLTQWGIEAKEGVYLLWHKDAYCAAHARFHMKCLYVGKGNIRLRLSDHRKSKDFSDAMLVYWSYIGLENRKAKYVEQLILDLYSIPMNVAESRGSNILCAHFTQSEVD